MKTEPRKWKWNNDVRQGASVQYYNTMQQDAKIQYNIL
jgi:hypothetical protein